MKTERETRSNMFGSIGECNTRRFVMIEFLEKLFLEKDLNYFMDNSGIKLDCLFSEF